VTVISVLVVAFAAYTICTQPIAGQPEKLPASDQVLLGTLESEPAFALALIQEPATKFSVAGNCTVVCVPNISPCSCIMRTSVLGAVPAEAACSVRATALNVSAPDVVNPAAVLEVEVEYSTI
jgi:hypothetical protein